ncbi:MAG: hypothetical protein AAF467_21215 [Actinomycetota bacterium]
MIGLLAVTLVLAGCASTPSREELAQSILDSVAIDPEVAIDANQALCVADQLLASQLSNTTLDGLASDFDNPTVLNTEQNRVQAAIRAAVAACV